MRSKQAAAPHLHCAFLFAVIGLTATSAHADDAAAIARIEAGLRPPVALANAPLKTATLQDAMTRLKVPGVSVAVIKSGWMRRPDRHGAIRAAAIRCCSRP